jgi:hypothetical protein
MRQKIITSLIILIGFSGGSVWAAGVGGGVGGAGAGVGTSGSALGTNGGATTGALPGSTMPGAIGPNGVTSNPGFGTTQGIGGYGTSPGLGNAQTTQQAGTAGNIGTSEPGTSNFQPAQPSINGGLNLGNTNTLGNPASNASIPTVPGTNPAGSANAQPLDPAATH